MTSNQLREKLYEMANNGEFSIADKEILIDIIIAQREALEEVKKKSGFCIFGTADLADSREEAFRQGSHYAWLQTGEMASEALTDTNERLRKLGVL